MIAISPRLEPLARDPSCAGRPARSRDRPRRAVVARRPQPHRGARLLCGRRRPVRAAHRRARARASESRSPASIRDELRDTRASSSSSVAPGRASGPPLGLRRPRPGRRRRPRPEEGASRRTPGGDLPARRAPGPPPTPASPPIPASTSSNTSVGGASDSTTPERQHRARELAAGRGLGQRPGRLARVRGQQERDVVGAVVGSGGRARPRPRIRPSASPARGAVR